MKSRTRVYEIACWEFARWFKWKDQIATVAIAMILALIIWGGLALLARAEETPVKLAVLEQDYLALNFPAGGRIAMQSAARQDEARLRELVGRGEIDGLLLVKSTDEAELLVYQEPVWQSEIATRLAEARMQAKIRTLGIAPAQLAEALRPLQLSVTMHTGGRATGTAGKIAAGVIVCLMLFGTFVGAAYMFVAITGEKQLRVTEMVVSAVSPQEWIDGKILGVSAYALAFTCTTAVSIVLFVLVSQMLGSSWEISAGAVHPAVILALLLLGLAGFLLWNTVFAAISATVNDPNTSARGALLLAPFLPVLFAMTVFRNPDALAARFFSVFPFTSPAVMPARLVLTQVPWWETALAIFLLAGGAWLFRSASGKIFRLGMLMHGKEPSFKEMLRWAREA